MTFEQEAAFEAALINLLTEKYGWEPEILRYKKEEDLIQNWKQILFENNRDVDRLNDVPLTDGEMQQILDQITRLRPAAKADGLQGRQAGARAAGQDKACQQAGLCRLHQGAYRPGHRPELDVRRPGQAPARV